jgi:hypothetical protein
VEGNGSDSRNDALLAGLRRLGPPVFVPAGGWWVAGVESSGGRVDGVLVFGGDGEIAIRTDLLTKRQPLSIRVSNVQQATVNSPDPAVQAQYGRVIVDEVERDVSVCGALHRVRVLASHNSFNLQLVVEGRLVDAAGRLSALDGLRIERLDELALTGE